LVLKEERRLEIYADGEAGVRFIREYPILAASGTSGPKLREGDNQVPEGIYAIESLNPNSAYHVSLRLNYPNAFDRAQAQSDGRSNLGGDIMIHGKAVSIGCVAVGDKAAEDIFTLAADTGLKNMKVVCSPIDFRRHNAIPRRATLSPWTDKLYAQIKSALSELPIARE
jgi:murein L,D-transpeptidase YafK